MSDTYKTTTGEWWATSLRIPASMARDLQAIARAEGKSMVEEIRDAINAFVTEKRRDPEFRERVRRLMEEERGVMERLAG